MNRFFRIFALTTVLVSGLAACSVEGPHSIVENPENNLPQMSEGVVSGELPLAGFEEPDIFKLYMLDIGLLGAMLQLDEETKRLRYPLNQLNESLRKQAGEVNTEWYHAICWCKDNLSDIDYREIYGIAGGKRQALVELQYAIKEIKKGKITQPGAFILSRLRKL